MVLQITVTKIQKVANVLGAGGASVDLGGKIDSGGNEQLSGLQAIDLGAQVAAFGAGSAAVFGPEGNVGTTAAAVQAGLFAFSTASAVFATDLANAVQDYNAGNITEKDKLTVAGDFVEMAGDAVIVTSAIANLNPETKPIAIIADLSGDALAGFGLYLDHLAEGPNPSEQTLTSVMNTANYDIGAVQTFLYPNASDVDASVNSLWNPVETALSNALSSASVAISDFNSASFVTNAINTEAFLGSTTTPLTNLFYGSGGVAQNITETANGTSVAVSADTGGTVLSTTDMFSSSDGSLTAFQSNNADGSGVIAADGFDFRYAAGMTSNISANSSGGLTVSLSSSGTTATPTFTLGTSGITANNTDGATLTDINVASNGSYTNTIFNTYNTVVSSYNVAGQLTTSTTSYESGYSSVTNYNTNPANSWQSESFAYNSSDQLIASSTLYDDGSYVQKRYDPTSGTLEESTTYTANGQPVLHYVDPNIAENQIIAGAAETAASQIIQQVLLKNNVPAAIVASSFVDAVVETATGTSQTGSFAGDFTADVFSSAVALGLGEGAAQIAKDLGVPSQLGGLVGGAAASFVTNTIVTSVAQDVGIATAAGQVLGAASFQTGLLAVPSEDIGQSLAAAITPPTIAGEITGDVLVAAESAALVVEGIAESLLLADPVTAVIVIVADLAGLDFIGNAIGDIATWIFGGGPRGAPFAEAEVGLLNGTFFDAGTSADNNGSPQPAIQLANDVITIMNQIIAAVGGTVTLATHWDVGYTGNNYISFRPGTTAYAQYSDAPDAIYDNVSHLLQNMTIAGGNPILKYILATDDLTNIPKLLSDLDIAQQYAVYAQSPVVFELALAEQGSASQGKVWQGVMASATTLGLANLSSVDGVTLTINTPIANISSYVATLAKMSGTPYNFIISDTSANFVANLGVLQNLAVNGHLDAVFLTDTGTPVLNLSAAQAAANVNALNALTGNFVLNVSDSAAHVGTALDQLQALLTNNKLSSLTLTDKGTPVLPIKATQIVSDAGILHMLGTNYKLAVTDTAANISANFATLQSLQAAGQLTSVTSTDGGKPALGLSYAQYTQGASVLALFTALYTLHLTDTGANVSNNLAALGSLAVSGKLTGITLTDTTKPALSVSVAQTTSYAGLLSMIAGQATVNVTGITPNTTTTITGNGFTLPLAASDTIQSNGTNSFTDALNGGNLTVTLANGKVVLDKSGNATFTTPLAGFGSSVLTVNTVGNATFTVGNDLLSFAGNSLQSVSYANGAFSFGLASNAAGYSQSVNWNPTTGQATLSVTGSTRVPLTTPLGQINPGGLLKVVGSTITNVNAGGQTLYSTTLNADGSQVDTQNNLSGGTTRDTITTYNGSGALVSTRWDNTNGTTYTSYYKPGTQTVIANLSVNADGSGYVATANNQTVNFTGSSLFTVSLDASGNPLVNLGPVAGNGGSETLDLAASQVTSTINGQSVSYTLPSPTISYDSSGNLTLTASGSTLVLPSNGSNYTFKVGQDTICLNPTSLISLTPNGTGYNFNLKPTGSGTEYVTWNPQTGIATLNVTSSTGQLTSTNMGYINPGYVLNVSSSLVTNTNASGMVINSYAVQTNGSVVSTASGSTYTFANANSILGLASNDTATISGSGDKVFASPNDTLTISGSNNTVAAFATDKITVTGQGDKVAVSDTTANIGANLTAEEILAKAGQITSITPTDGNTNSLALTTAQLTQDVDALNKLTPGSFSETVAITPASIAGNVTGTAGGNNMLSFISAASAVTVNLASAGTAIMGSGTYHISGFQSVVGSPYADNISAGSANETLTGGGGSDTYTGYSGGLTTVADTAAHLNGTIYTNFLATDSIVATDMIPQVLKLAFTENASNTFGTLIFGNGTVSASVVLNGQHTAGQIYASANSSGGTIIQETSLTGSALTAFQAAHPTLTFG